MKHVKCWKVHTLKNVYLEQDIWVAVGLEQGPLSLASINEELLERKVVAPV
jgi:hypothetical protein